MCDRILRPIFTSIYSTDFLYPEHSIQNLSDHCFPERAVTCTNWKLVGISRDQLVQRTSEGQSEFVIKNRLFGIGLQPVIIINHFVKKPRGSVSSNT